MVVDRGKGVTRAFQELAAAGQLGGILLLFCAVCALTWANSPWAGRYFALWETPLSVGPAGHTLTLPLQAWINDGLMTVFFLLVGLEIKREVLVGELSVPRQAALPIAAAVGGMLLPALCYALVNCGGSGARGWGIPMATDIAFALAILGLFGARIPSGHKVFLTALAIVDDLGAVLIIAIFYTSAVNPYALSAAAAILVLLLVLNRIGVSALAPYLVLGGGLWLAVHESGVHATVAGVLLALVIPSRSAVDAMEFSTEARAALVEFDRGETGDALVLTSPAQREALYTLANVASKVEPPLLRMEHLLQNPVAYLVMPLFALANAGLTITGSAALLQNPVAVGIVLGLLVGKTLGIMIFSWLAVRLKLAERHHTLPWGDLLGLAWLGGIGFTMALFIATLAFAGSPLLEPAKAGVIAGSSVAGLVGYLRIHRQLRCGTPAAPGHG